jgi:hypothetical protein
MTSAQLGDTSFLIDSAHAEAYTVIIFGILSGIALVALRPWSGKAFPNGCGDVSLRATGGGSVPASYLFGFRLVTFVYATGLFIRHANNIGFFRILRWIIHPL